MAEFDHGAQPEQRKSFTKAIEDLCMNYRQKKHPHLLIAAIALIIFTVLYMFASFGLSLYVEMVPESRDDYSFNMVMIIISQLLCMLPPVLILCHMRKMDFLSVMRLRKGVNFLQVLMLIGISFGLIYVANGLNNIFLSVLEMLTGYVPTGSNPPMDNVGQMLFAALLYGMLPAFCEEFFYRGLVMRSLERFSPAVAVIGSALLFGIMHGNLTQIVFAAVIGVVLAIVVRRTDSLVPSMIIHFTNNFLAMVITYVQQGMMDSGVMEEVTQAVGPFETIISSVGMISMGIPFVGLIIPYIIYTKSRNRRKYGQGDPEELRGDYADLLQSGNVAYRENGEVVRLNRAGRIPALAYILLGIFLAGQALNIILDFAVNTGMLA